MRGGGGQSPIPYIFTKSKKNIRGYNYGICLVKKKDGNIHPLFYPHPLPEDEKLSTSHHETNSVWYGSSCQIRNQHTCFLIICGHYQPVNNLTVSEALVNTEQLHQVLFHLSHLLLRSSLPHNTNLGIQSWLYIPSLLLCTQTPKYNIHHSTSNI